MQTAGSSTEVRVIRRKKKLAQKLSKKRNVHKRSPSSENVLWTTIKGGKSKCYLS